MPQDIATKLIEFALKTKYEDIPEEVIAFSKHLTLKTVSGMLAGSAKPSGRKMAKIIRDRKLPEEVGVMGSGFKTSLWESIFLDTYFAHASELEDDRFNGGISWDITVIGLLFPLAEKLCLSGKAFLESLILGLEVHCRTCLFSPKHLGLGQIPGAVGPAVAAARASGLSVQETAAAVGLSMSSVPLTVVNYGTDAHYFESALIPRQAMIAVEMAKKGLAGNPDLAAFLTYVLGKERVVPEKMLEDLGKRWVVGEIWVKKYPCCFLQHRQIDSVIEMKQQHNLSAEDVEAIEVHVSMAEKLCDRPQPENERDLQFSFQHVLSAAMLDGDVGLKHITPKLVSDERLREARSKVKIIYHPELTIEFNQAPARVVIKTKDGREFSRERMYPIGHPTQAPLATEQIQGLYAKFTAGILKKTDIPRTAEMILNVEKLRSLKELIRILDQRP